MGPMSPKCNLVQRVILCRAFGVKAGFKLGPMKHVSQNRDTTSATILETLEMGPRSFTAAVCLQCPVMGLIPHLEH